MEVLLFKAPSEIPDSEDPYVLAFEEAGLAAKVVNVIEFEYLNTEYLKTKIKSPDEFGGLILTSPRSVLAIKQCIEGDLKGTGWAHMPCYVVGESTNKILLQQLGLTGAGESSGNAEALASFICKDVAGKQIKPLLFPSAEQGRAVLPNILHNNTVAVDIITSYRTIPHSCLKERLQTVLNCNSTMPTLLVFFSPSGVSSVIPILNNLVKDVKDLKLIAIGTTTQQALEQHGLHVFVTATKPTPISLVDSLKLALNER